MNLPRDAAVSHFSPTFQVHCLKFWPKRAKTPPETLPRCLHEWIKASKGRMDLELPAFRAIVEPFIAELHRERKGAQPEPSEFTAALYDSLSQASVEATIGRSPKGTRS